MNIRKALVTVTCPVVNTAAARLPATPWYPLVPATFEATTPHSALSRDSSQQHLALTASFLELIAQTASMAFVSKHKKDPLSGSCQTRLMPEPVWNVSTALEMRNPCYCRRAPPKPSARQPYPSVEPMKGCEDIRARAIHHVRDSRQRT